ncbi:MAG: type VI secretion system tube protein Hcp [Verrucomicrobiaceae bacterium]|nr:MAG: type VI secretion system tube protein Hcp [Verrucomicrobiaceae bacterium]
MAMRSSRPSSLSRTLALVPPAVALVAQQANGDMFLKVEGVTGESLDKNHAGWIEVSAMDFKIENAVTLGAGSGTITASKSKGSALTITKLLDRSSPVLFLGCASGTVYPTVTLDVTRLNGSGTPVTYYKITLSNVIVSNLGTSSLGERPAETVALSYEKIVTDYFMADSKGGVPSTPTTTATWNFATNSSK